MENVFMTVHKIPGIVDVEEVKGRKNTNGMPT